MKKRKMFMAGIFMKNCVSGIVLVVMLGLIISCVSIENRGIPMNERAETNIIGTVSTNFHSFQFGNFIPKQKIIAKAYEHLKSEAQRKYSGNIDIVNIQINGSFSSLQFINIAAYASYMAGLIASDFMIELVPTLALPFLIGNFQKINATGDVILLDAQVGVSLSIRNKIQELLPKINEDIISSLPTGSRIAILSISTNDQTLAEYIIDDLEWNLVDSRKFIIVDRRRLDDIRIEQNFQLSGDVSDVSAVSIGHMIGANVVIVGNISTTATRGHVTIRALNVETGQVIAIASEQF
jgi:hypothetical protein